MKVGCLTLSYAPGRGFDLYRAVNGAQPVLIADGIGALELGSFLAEASRALARFAETHLGTVRALKPRRKVA